MLPLVPAGATASVLFVGNSFTRRNDLPGRLARLAAATGRELEVAMSARGGETLAGHAGRAETLAALAGRAWDLVVLQGHSAEPIFDREGMIAGAQSLAERCGDARLLAYLTWAYRDRATLLAKVARHLGAERVEEFHGDTHARMLELLLEGYRELAAAIGAVVVPVGCAWQVARAAHPEWELFTADGFHPSSLGTWLTALVFHRHLLGELPERVPSADDPDDGLPDEATFAALRTVATLACDGWRG